jgi:hypothetical protein
MMGLKGHWRYPRSHRRPAVAGSGRERALSAPPAVTLRKVTGSTAECPKRQLRCSASIGIEYMDPFGDSEWVPTGGINTSLAPDLTSRTLWRASGHFPSVCACVHQVALRRPV